jgi:hypothetical protein
MSKKLVKIGEIPWTRENIIEQLDDFLELYDKRPIPNNGGGMRAPHCFATYFMMKYLNKPYIIESGIWKGQSTWLIEKTCPKAQLLCIDPLLHIREYISKKAKYTVDDWSKLNIRNTKETLCFFDDHQNAVDRIKSAVKRGFKHLIFKDNYPTGQGDCISLKQSFDKDDDVSKFLKKHIEIYYEFPPIFKTDKSRWGDDWNELNYPTQIPIFKDLKGNEKYNLFYTEADSYTWIAYVKLL